MAADRLKSLWDSFKGFFGSEVRLTEAEVDVPFGSLTLELRNRPTARAKLREGIERLATDLIGAFNELLLDANAAIRRAGGAGLVLIVDGLEKMSRREISPGVNSHDRLFIDRSAHLAGLEANVVYTVPISLYYSPQCTVLEQAFGEFNWPVPMIKVRRSRDEPVTPHSVGMQRLWEMLDLRCKAARVPIAEVFPDDGVWQYLCEMSGGHPRHLLMRLPWRSRPANRKPPRRPFWPSAEHSGGPTASPCWWPSAMNRRGRPGSSTGWTSCSPRRPCGLPFLRSASTCCRLFRRRWPTARRRRRSW